MGADKRLDRSHRHRHRPLLMNISSSKRGRRAFSSASARVATRVAARRLLLSATMVVVPGLAAAHETWVKPEARAYSAPSTIVLNLTSGTDFPKLGVGPKAPRVARAAASVRGKAQSVVVGAGSVSALKLTVRPTTPGLVVVAVSLTPHDIDLSSEKVDEYFQEVAPSTTVLGAWRALPEPKTWRETYVKNAKALVCIGRCDADRNAMGPIGANLEFVALAPGASPATFKVLAAGRPLPGQLVQVFDEHGLRVQVRTDASGRLDVPQDARGWTLLSSVWLRPPSAPGERFRSDFASMVLDVGQ